jgi:hypothetical protein
VLSVNEPAIVCDGSDSDVVSDVVHVSPVTVGDSVADTGTEADTVYVGCVSVCVRVKDLLSVSTPVAESREKVMLTDEDTERVRENSGVTEIVADSVGGV